MSGKPLLKISGKPLMLPLLLTGLLGCQATGPLAPALPAPAKAEGPACYVSSDSLAHLLRLQHRYLLAGSGEQRERQLMEARQSHDKALEGLLLTSPAATGEETDRGVALLGSLPLYPDDRCIADRYLFLHLSQVQHAQARQSELNARDEEITELKRKIEALTDLEQQITRQRKDL